MIRTRALTYDIVIVGGSTSGLSAALSLGRSKRHVLVVDEGQPCNLPQAVSHNLLGFDGVSPAKIHSISRSNVAAYPTVDFLDFCSVTNLSIAQNGDNNSNGEIIVFTDREKERQTLQARKLLIATGVRDVLPTREVQGIQECWGKTAIHCPYCHGYEFRDKRTALIRMSPATLLTMVPILSHLTSELFIIGNYIKTARDQVRQLERHNKISLLLDHDVVSLRHTNGFVKSLTLDDEREIAMDVVYLRPPFVQQFPVDTLQALHLDDKGYINVDPVTQQTNVANVYACGDCTDPNRALSIAMASGTRAAKMLNYELSMEDFWTK